MIFALFADILNSLQRRCLMLVLALYVFERQFAVTQQLAELENNFSVPCGRLPQTRHSRYILPEVEQFFLARVTDNLGLKRSFSAIGKLFDALGTTLNFVSFA